MSKSINKKFLFLFVLFVSINLSVVSQVDFNKSDEIRFINGKEYYIHIIEKGHTLYSLARVYEVTKDEIIFENPLAGGILSIGLELKIPVNSRDEDVKQSLRSNDEFFFHVVKLGESMNGIAATYLISVRDIERANPTLSDPLKNGQYVKIPVSDNNGSSVNDRKQAILKPTGSSSDIPSSSNNDVNLHIVKAGDNLYRIALKYQVSVEELKSVNRGLNENLYIGQRIQIPSKKKENDFIYHKVKRRSKLIRVARNYNIDIQHLRESNPYTKEKLKSGDIIRIPLKPKKEIIEDVPLIENNAIVNSNLNLDEFQNPDSLKCMNYIGNVQDTFKISLMIPLYLEEVDSLSFTENTNIEDFLDETPFRFLQFYYGVVMAVDSMRALGMNIELSVFDVDNSIGKSIQVLQDPNLPEQDLIIGPFFRASFKLASSFAKIFEIPIVNPLSNRIELIENNPFVYKCQSNENSQFNKVRDLVNTYFKDSKIFLVKHEKDSIEKDFPLYISEFSGLIDTGYYIQNDKIFDLIIEKSIIDTTTVHISNEFIATLDSLTGITTEIDSLFIEDELLQNISIEGTYILTDTIEFNLYDSTYIKNRIVPYYYAQDSMYSFQDEASIYRENVVFVFADENVFALDLMTKLNIEKDTFSTTVIGLPDWREFENMDNEILNNLKAHVLYSGHVNYQDRHTNNFIYEFRKQHLTEPLDYAFKGFDISWYFLNALNNFGKSFENCLPYYNQSYLQSKLDFKRMNKGNGFENQFWTVLKYNRYRLSEIEVFPPKLPVGEDLKDN